MGTVTAEPSSLEAVGRPAAKPDAAEAPEAKSIHDVCGHSAGPRETHLLKDAAAGSESAGMAGRGTESSLWAPLLTGERARGKKTAGVSQQPQWSQKSWKFRDGRRHFQQLDLCRFRLKNKKRVFTLVLQETTRDLTR